MQTDGSGGPLGMSLRGTGAPPALALLPALLQPQGPSRGLLLRLQLTGVLLPRWWRGALRAYLSPEA